MKGTSKSRSSDKPIKVIKARRIFSKAEIISEINTLKDKEWLPMSQSRFNRDGGLGNSLEDYLKIAENNLALADLGTYELKTHRAKSNSLISLFRKEPGSRGDALIPKLMALCGWPISRCPTKIKQGICPHDLKGVRDRCYPEGERSLRVDMDGRRHVERGFKIKIDRNTEKIEIHFDPNSVHQSNIEWLKNIQDIDALKNMHKTYYWKFDIIRSQASQKLKNMVYITLDTKVENDMQYKKIIDVKFFESFDFEKFLRAIELGEVQIEFSGRTNHNHGTAFRTWERYWSHFYDIVKPL